MSTQHNQVLTIGHSTHTIEAFVELLQKHGVTAVADVRSFPFSRYTPQFNKDALRESLKSQGIKYVFLGRELGARSEDATCYENGRVRYARLARTATFQSGLDRVIEGGEKYRLALMCAEKEPLECHRTLLVARALSGKGIQVSHILADGTLEPQDNALGRLLAIVGVPPQDLFRSRDQLIEEALARQEEKVAYVDEQLAGEARGGGV